MSDDTARSSSHPSLPPERVGELLNAASHGDQAAWRSLVEHFAPRVFGLLRAQCGDADLAEELTQSTFCTMAAKIESYVEAGKFEAWLFRIALNRLRDEGRRRARHAAPTDDAVLASLTGTGRPSARGPTDVAVPDDIAALRVAMSKLSPADQRVVHLRHASGLSFKEIAEALDEPLGTLLARHHRALKKLKELIAGEERRE